MILSLALLGCPRPPPPPAAAAAVAAPLPVGITMEWVSPVDRDHPLVGRVWSVAQDRAATWEELVADVKGVPFVFLGEKHDNTDHHALQARAIAALAPGAAVFEHLDHADPIGLATTSDALATASGWDQSGWPPFDLYRPVFDAVFAAGARVIAGHPTRDEVKLAMNEGYAALAPEVTEGLPLDRPLPAAELADLSDEIVRSHCGMANAEMVDKMIRAQVLKDTTMARAMTRAAAETGKPPTVLVAGNGHTRGDRGVPLWLEGPRRVVAFLEVNASETDPRDYVEGADWIVFTPRHDDDDPCAAFRK